MPMPTRIVPVARAADLMENGHAIRHAITKWGASLDVATGLDLCACYGNL
jgi:hypothetical protein